MSVKEKITWAAGIVLCLACVFSFGNFVMLQINNNLMNATISGLGETQEQFEELRAEVKQAEYESLLDAVQLHELIEGIILDTEPPTKEALERAAAARQERVEMIQAELNK